MASLRSGRIRQLPRRVLGSRTRAVQAVWESTMQPPITFWHIPQVHQHANRLVSGDPQVDYISYVARKYLAGRSLAGLSLGCGTGYKELRWAGCGNLHAWTPMTLPRSALPQPRPRPRRAA